MSAPSGTEIDTSETETVGYKRPPRQTQFKAGLSGNPRGRPKRKKLDIGLALNKALNDKVVVTGLGKTMTGFEAVVQSIVHRVLQGESKAIPELVRLFAKAKLFKPVADPTRLTGVVSVVIQIRTYRWCSPPRIGRQRMCPASSRAREIGASFSKDKCVRISL